MAFIPDEALKNFPKLTPAGRLLYGHLCMYRDHQTGKTWRTMTDLKTLQADLDLSRPAIFRAKKELLELGWIEFEADTYAPVFGNFNPSGQSQKRDSNTPQSLKNDTQESQKLDSPVSKMILPSLKNDTPQSQKRDCDMNNERARLLSSPISSLKEKKEERESRARIPLCPVLIFEKVSGIKPNPVQRSDITETVQDFEKWEQVCTDCARRNFHTVENFLDVYRNGFRGERQNGTSQRNDSEVSRTPGYDPRKIKSAV